MTVTRQDEPVSRAEVAEIVEVLREHAMIVMRLAIRRDSDPELEEALIARWTALDDRLRAF